MRCGFLLVLLSSAAVAQAPAALALSPDGATLVVLRTDPAGDELVALPLEGGPERVLLSGAQRLTPPVLWTADSKTLLFARAAGEVRHVFALTLEGGALRDLTPWPGANAAVLAVSAGAPDVVLVRSDQRGGDAWDVHRVTLSTGKAVLDTQATKAVHTALADSRLAVRVLVSTRPGGGTEVLVRDTARAKFRSLIRAGPEETVKAWALSLDGRSLTLSTSIGGRIDRLVQKHLVSGTERLLLGHPDSGVGTVLFHPSKGYVQAARFDVGGAPRWLSLELESTKADLDALEAQGPVLDIVRDAADATWVVTRPSGQVQRWQRKERRATQVLAAPKPSAAP